MNHFSIVTLFRASPAYSLFRYSKYSGLHKLLTEMPKDTKHTAVLKTQRVKMKEKRQKYSPGTVTLQVLGSGAKGAPRALYLFTDQSRYLFNCGEGAQRLAHEHKMKLSKLEHIFLTYPSWENLGGLPGVALTIQDVGVPEITLHGPEGVDEIFTATKRFVVLNNLSVHMADCQNRSQYEDSAIKVMYVPIHSDRINSPMEVTQNRSSPSSPEEGTDDDTDYYAYESFTGSPKQQRKRKLSTSDEKVVKKQVTESGVTMCYICEVQSRTGSLSLERCVELGVPPGPLLGRLKSGEDVVLNDGSIVRSAEVTQPTEYGPLFIVVDCPNKEYLNNLVAENKFKEHQSNGSKLQAFAIIHFTPEDIINEPIYKEWMDKFPPSTHHMILNSSNVCMGSVAVHRIQYKLNLLEPNIFPLLKDNGFAQVENKENSNLEREFSVIRGQTFRRVALRPCNVIDNSGGLKLNPEEYIEEVHKVEGFLDELGKLKNRLLDSKSVEYPNVVFLGTGSCIPNKTRNTSSILLNIREGVRMLLDCGEGTYGQLCRYYGREGVDTVMKELQCVYVSHLHADHHIGLVGLLKARETLTDQTLYLLAPKQIMTWLRLYHRHFERILDRLLLVPNTDMLVTDYTLNEELKEKLSRALDSSEVNTTYVKHCPNSFGVSITNKAGWKITYSGDTMPTDRLVSLGKDSDLLIHEATMEDELEDEAKLKFHSTTSQAIEIGRKMGAKFTLLTHFSQRYAKMPRLNDSFSNNVGIAFDNMQVSLSDLNKLPLLYPALRLMFQEECEELELKAQKRQFKLERELKNKVS